MKYWTGNKVAAATFMAALVFAGGFLEGVYAATAAHERIAVRHHAGYYAPDTGSFVWGNAP